MSAENACPHCGCPLDATHAQLASTEVIESLSREVQHLRETVARLRGAGGARSDPTAVTASVRPYRH
jgi:hypothetical protein